MIHIDALDVGDCRSEEVRFLLTLSVQLTQPKSNPLGLKK